MFVSGPNHISITNSTVCDPYGNIIIANIPGTLTIFKIQTIF